VKICGALGSLFATANLYMCFWESIGVTFFVISPKEGTR
jgi:hypothetical protein